MLNNSLVIVKQTLIVLGFSVLFIGLGLGGGYYVSTLERTVKLSKAADFTGDVSARDLKLTRAEIRMLNTSIANSLDVVKRVDINLSEVPQSDPFYSEGGYRYKLNLRAKRGFDFVSRERYARRAVLVAHVADAITTESNALRAVLMNPVYKDRTPKRILHTSFLRHLALFNILPG